MSPQAFSSTNQISPIASSNTFPLGTVSTFFTIFTKTCLLWALSNADTYTVILSDTHTDQGHVQQNSCLSVVLELMLNDKHFSFKQETRNVDGEMSGMRVVFKARHSNAGGIFMFGLFRVDFHLWEMKCAESQWNY